MKISYINQIDENNVIADDNAYSDSYPIDNVKNPFLSRIYRSNNEVNITVDGGRDPRFLGVERTNILYPLTPVYYNADVVNSGEYIDEQEFIKVEANNSSLYSNMYYTYTSTEPDTVAGFICRKGTAPKTGFTIRKVSDNTIVASATIDFDLKTVVDGGGGDIHDYTWLDDETVEVYLVADSTLITVGDSLKVSFFGNWNTTDDYSTYWAKFFVIETDYKAYPPFVENTEPATIDNYSLTMPKRHTFDIEFYCNFNYDTSNKRIMRWDSDDGFFALIHGPRYSDTRLFIQSYYFKSNSSGGSYAKSAGIYSVPLDETGAGGNINIKQKLRVVGSIDMTNQELDNSIMFLIEEDGTMHQFTGWEDNYANPTPPPIQPDPFTELILGPFNPNITLYKYKLYANNITDTITTVAELDTYISKQDLLFEKVYQENIPATDFYIAGSNIRRGDIITLKANNYDSWGPGIPFERTIEYREDIIKDSFDFAEYPYWRVYINSADDLYIGRLWLGESIEVLGPGDVFAEEVVNTSRSSISISGQVRGDVGYSYKMYDMAFPLWNSDEKSLIEDFAGYVNKSKYFFTTFADCDDKELGPIYGIMTNNIKIQHLNKLNMWSSQINFREAF
jgi:hypothetical protein